jgi:hypothetical protein
MGGLETGGGRLAAGIVTLVVLFAAAWGSKWLIVTTSWGIWAVLAALAIIALGFVLVNWRGKSK